MRPNAPPGTGTPATQQVLETDMGRSVEKAEASAERRGIRTVTQPDTAVDYGPVMRFTIWFSSTRAGQWIYARVIPPVDRRLMLWSGGRWSLSPKGEPEKVGGLALLTTTGARTGRLRHTPLGFARDGESILVLASNGASPRNPAWYFNLKKNPRVTITTAAGDRGDYVAEEIAPGSERERLWKVLCRMNPGFEKYPARTGGRIIPVILCKPAAKTPPTG